MNAWVEILCSVLIQATLGISIAAMGVGLTLRFSGIRSPVVHRIAWSLVLLQGVVFVRLIHWDIPVLESQHSVSAPSHHATQDAIRFPGRSAATPSDRETTTGEPLVDFAAATQFESFGTMSPASERATKTPHSEQTGLSKFSMKSSDSVTASAASKISAPRHNRERPALPSPPLSRSSLSWKVLLLLAWGMGIVGLLLANFVGFLVFNSSAGSAIPASEAWDRPWRRLLWEAGMPRVPMKVHRTAGPMICWRPGGFALIVPVDLWEELNSEQRLSVLRHELAHYVRGDVWKSLGVRSLAIVYWFNPFAWLAVRRFEESGEWACDQSMIDVTPEQGTEFANALLQIVQLPPPSPFCVSSLTSRAASGSLLSERIRRLLSKQPKDSLMKRMAVSIALVGVLMSCLIQIQAVARPRQSADDDLAMQVESDSRPETQPESSEHSDSLTPEDAVKDFASRIQSEEDDDELTANLKRAVATEPGRIALLERTSWAEEQLRQRAEDSAIPLFLSTRFDTGSGGELTLKSDQTPFRDDFIQRCRFFEQDVAAIQKELSKISAHVSGDTEADKMLRQFTMDKNAGWLIYVNGLRELIRPDMRSLQERLSGLMVANEEGKLSVRPGGRQQVAEMIREASRVEDIVESVHAELTQWSEEMAEPDELHKRLKSVLANRFYASIVCVDQLMDGPESVERKTEQFFENLEWTFKDTSDGLVINQEAQWMEELVRDFEHRNRLVPVVKRPLQKMADNIDTADAEGERLRKLLTSSFAIVRVTADMDDISPDAATALHRELEHLTGGAEVESFSVPEEMQESVIEFVAKNKVLHRQLRRKFREIDKQAATIQDPGLKKAFLSEGGKCMLIQSIREKIAFQRFDGLGHWINENFDQTSVGYILKDESRDEIREYLEQVKQMETELKNDDF